MTFLAAIQVGISTALFASLWQVTALALSACAVLALLDRQTAGFRHGVAMLFLIACVAAPIVTVVQVLTAIEPPELSVASTLASGAPPAVLAWVWGLGVACKLAQLAASWCSFRRLEASAAEPLPPAWQAKIERLRLRFGIGRPVDVRLTAGVLPCTARLLRPIIWMPATLFTQMTSDQIEAVLAHELAHIRRCDWLWNGVQNAVETLLFYHPGVWWLSRRIRQERENACDDLAVTACGDPLVLAEALGRLEVLRAPVLVLSSQGGSLMKRISRLLIPEARSPARWAMPAAALAIIGVGAALTLQSGAASAADDSPRWWQLHGDAMQINGTVAGEHRGYTRWHDGSGRQRERYFVNGVGRPINAAARQWVARTAAPPPPPAPPLPPRLRRITDDSLYQLAVRQIAVDPALVARLGAPVRVQGIAGPSYLDERRVDLTLNVIGSHGAAQVQRIGSVEEGRWSFHTNALDPAR